MDHAIESIIGLVAGINDTVKVKLQAFPEIHRSAMSCFKETLLKDGLVRGLYAGTLPALVANVADNAVTFSVLPSCQKIVSGVTGQQEAKSFSPILHGCSGSIAGLFTSLVLCPAELIKCRVQSFREMALLNPNRMFPQGPLAVTKHVLHTEGVRGLFRGFFPTLVREVPGFFCFFGAYELTRELMTPAGKTKDDLSPAVTALAGGTGGVSLWLAVYPIDLAKSRIQIGHTSPTGMHTPPDRSLHRILFQIFKNEGVRALYKGLTPTLIRTIPSTATLFVAVEWTKKLAGNLS